MPYIPNDEELDIQLAASGKEPQGQPDGSLNLDIYHDDGDIVIQSAIAGVTKEDIEIEFVNDQVTISGTRKPDIKVPTKNYYYQEIYWGPFSRTVILPEAVDFDNAKARFDDKKCILTIRIPTLEKSQKKKIKIELK